MIPSISLVARYTLIVVDDKSKTVTIATWLLMAVFIVVFLLRETIRYAMLRKFTIDDFLILLAVVFGIGFSITILILVSDGLGVLGTLTINRANAIMKGYYASDFLYLSSICFAKMSLITFLHCVVVDRFQRRIIQGLGVFVLVWTLVSLASVAFQCGLPKPWEMMTLHCYNRGVFWIVYCIIDMTTEVCVIMLSVNLVAYSHIQFSRKVVAVACFAPRIFVVAATLARLVYLYPITPHDNPEYHLWIPVICAEVQICISISTACIPFAKPFPEGADADHRRSRCVKVNNLRGYQAVPGFSKGHKRGKELYSVDSTASMSLKCGRTPDVSPRIPSPVPLTPLTLPRFSTPPIPTATNSGSPSQRGLKLHIPPDILVRPATDIISPQTASSHALSPELLSSHQQPLLHSPRRSPKTVGPSPPPRSHSPRPSLSNSPGPSPDHPHPITPPRAPSFSLFPKTKTAQTSPISLVPRLSPPLPPIPTPRARPTSESRNRNRISSHRMVANTSQPRATTRFANLPVRTSSLPQDAQPKPPKRNNIIPQSVPQSVPQPAPQPVSQPVPQPVPQQALQQVPPPMPQSTNTAASSPTLPSSHFATPYSPNPHKALPPNPPLSAVHSNPQRMRNQRILMPQNSSRKEQMSPVSPPSATPKTPQTFWRDESSSEGGALSAGTRAELEGESPWRAERPWEKEPMPIVRKVGRGSPKVVHSRPQ